ncbi:MAG: hypothetical protein K8U03_20270 [Planctomycetia bacterium]|nr:hypothetical protein [Planctomycetia bacterium]
MPHTLANANPEILLIGAISLIILFGKPLINVPWVKLIPAPLIVLLVAVPLGMYFDLPHTHTFSFLGHDYELSEKYLVSVPENLFNAITHPDFSALARPVAWKWVLMYCSVSLRCCRSRSI